MSSLGGVVGLLILALSQAQDSGLLAESGRHLLQETCDSTTIEAWCKCPAGATPVCRSSRCTLCDCVENGAEVPSVCPTAPPPNPPPPPPPSPPPDLGGQCGGSPFQIESVGTPGLCLVPDNQEFISSKGVWLYFENCHRVPRFMWKSASAYDNGNLIEGFEFLTQTGLYWGYENWDPPDGETIRMWDDLWRGFISHPVGGDNFYLQLYHHQHKCVHSSNGGNPVQFSRINTWSNCNLANTPGHQWKANCFAPPPPADTMGNGCPDGKFIIQAAMDPTYCLHPFGGAANNLVNPVWYPACPTTAASIQFQLEPAFGDGSVYIKNVGTGNYLHPCCNFNSQSNGDLPVWFGGTGAHTIWYIDHIGDGKFVMRWAAAEWGSYYLHTEHAAPQTDSKLLFWETWTIPGAKSELQFVCAA
mmetsp:Transcript_11182/g.36815  ORF Transcript_11182/g.36815 Transcript_11182/m.36815 type:complete len:416 (-) Transcript_11182:216-1463(-)